MFFKKGEYIMKLQQNILALTLVLATIAAHAEEFSFSSEDGKATSKQNGLLLFEEQMKSYGLTEQEFKTAIQREIEKCQDPQSEQSQQSESNCPASVLSGLYLFETVYFRAIENEVDRRMPDQLMSLRKLRDDALIDLKASCGVDLIPKENLFDMKESGINENNKQTNIYSNAVICFAGKVFNFHQQVINYRKVLWPDSLK